MILFLAYVWVSDNNYASMSYPTRMNKKLKMEFYSCSCKVSEDSITISRTPYHIPLMNGRTLQKEVSISKYQVAIGKMNHAKYRGWR